MLLDPWLFSWLIDSRLHFPFNIYFLPKIITIVHCIHCYQWSVSWKWSYLFWNGYILISNDLHAGWSLIVQQLDSFPAGRWKWYVVIFCYCSGLLDADAKDKFQFCIGFGLEGYPSTFMKSLWCDTAFLWTFSGTHVIMILWCSILFMKKKKRGYSRWMPKTPCEVSARVIECKGIVHVVLQIRVVSYPDSPGVHSVRKTSGGDDILLLGLATSTYNQ